MEKAFINKNRKFLRAISSSLLSSTWFSFFFPVKRALKMHQKGFSLVELLIVVTLITILSFIAVPQLTNLTNNARLRGASRLVWGDLYNAKMIAIKTNQSITVTFGSTTSYSFPWGDGTTFTRNLASEYPNVTASKSGGGSITFSSTGMTQQNATVTIQNAQGSKSISVLWTGRILIT